MKKKIKIEQLRPGMFIDRFDRGWLDHPFFKNRIKVSSEKTIRKIIECRIREVYIDTDKGLDVDENEARKPGSAEERKSGRAEAKGERKSGRAEAKGERKSGRAEERKEEEREAGNAAQEKPHVEREEKDKGPDRERKEVIRAEEGEPGENGAVAEFVPSGKKETSASKGAGKETGGQDSKKAQPEGREYAKEGADMMPSPDTKAASESKGIGTKAVEGREEKKADTIEEIRGAEPREVSEAKEGEKDRSEQVPYSETEEKDAKPSAEETDKKEVKAAETINEKRDRAGAGNAEVHETQIKGQYREEEKSDPARRGAVPGQDREMTMEELRREAVGQRERAGAEMLSGKGEKGAGGFTVQDRRITIDELRREAHEKKTRNEADDNEYQRSGHSGGGSFVVQDGRLEDRDSGWRGVYGDHEKNEDGRDEDAVRAPVSVQEELLKAKEIRNEAKKTMKKILEDVRFGKRIEMDRVESVVEKMVDSIFRNKDALTGLGRIKKVDEYTFMHSVSVGVLMISFGKYLGFDYDLVKAIGIGGLLHDMGKIKVPGNILTKEGKLSDDEMRMMKRHVEDSRLILEETPGINEISISVAAHHHERLDGTGYPNHLKGEDISIFGQMSAIVDVYDALTSDRCYQKGILPTEALKRLYGWNAHYNKELLQQFVRCMGIYPVGTLVRLQSGLLGVVLSHNEDNLMYPIVRVVYDTQKETFTMPDDIDLLEEFRNGGTDRVVGYEVPEKWRIRPETYL